MPTVCAPNPSPQAHFAPRPVKSCRRETRTKETPDAPRTMTERSPTVLHPQPSTRGARSSGGPVVLLRYAKGWGLGELLCSDPLVDALLERHGADARIFVEGPAGNVAHHPRIEGAERPGLKPDHTVDLVPPSTPPSEPQARLAALPTLIQQMCGHADVDPGDARPQLHLGPREHGVAERFRSLGLDGPVVALCADTIDPLRHWPRERWGELAAWLRAEGCTVVNLGVRDTSGVGIELVGKLNIRDTAAVLGTCDLFVGNNGALLHYAQAAGVPCVATFSLATPSRFVHPGATVTPVQADLACIDCSTRTPSAFARTGCIAAPQGRCMLDISVETMKAAVEAAVTAPEPATA